MKKYAIHFVLILLLCGLAEAQSNELPLPPTNIAEIMTPSNAEDSDLILTINFPLRFLPNKINFNEELTLFHMNNREEVKLWNVELNEEIMLNITELDTVNQNNEIIPFSLSYISSDGRWLVLSRYDAMFPSDFSLLELYDIESGSLNATLSTSGWPIISVVIDHNNIVYFIDCSENVTMTESGMSCSSINLARWDSDSNTALEPIQDIPTNEIVGVNNDASQAVTAGIDPFSNECEPADESDQCVDYVYNLYDMEQFEVTQNFRIPQTESASDGSPIALFSPDGSRLALANPVQLLIVDPHSGEEIIKFEEHQSEITAIAFSPNSDLIAVAAGRYHRNDKALPETITEDIGIRIIEVETGEVKQFIPLLPPNTSPNDFAQYVAVALTFTPDGRLLLFSANSGIGVIGVPNENLCSVATNSPVNTRQLPTIQSPQQDALPAGSEHFADGQITGDDGFVWWHLTDGRWVRSDIVQATTDCDNLPQIEAEE